MSSIRTFLAGCTTMAAALAAVFSLTGAKAPANHAHFDEITVGRINIVEPDGTKRLIISNRAQFPGDFVQGKEGKRPDRSDVAGMLFINDEGTENGGFVYNGLQKADGTVDAELSLTFDRFRQDQALQLFHGDNEKSSNSAIKINDVPSYTSTSLDDQKKIVAEGRKMTAAEREAFYARMRDEGRFSRNRVFLGTTDDSSSSLTLKDALGKPRMQLLVTAQGRAEIRMLDADGKVIKTVTPDS